MSVERLGPGRRLLAARAIPLRGQRNSDRSHSGARGWRVEPSASHQAEGPVPCVLLFTDSTLDPWGFALNLNGASSNLGRWTWPVARLPVCPFITKNWRGKPLVTHKVIVECISATTPRAGLTVRSRLDETKYKKGIRITNAQLADVNLHPDKFHGEWNYTIHPTTA